MFSTVSIATLFLINVYNFYSITADGQANIGNISAKDLTSDGQTPRSAQIPSEIGMETNSTIENKTPKDLTSDGQTPRSAQIPSEIGMETNSTIDKKTPRFDEMPKDLAIDGKLVQSKVKTKKNLAIDNKTPRFDEMPKDLAIDGKLVQSKVKAKNNLTSGNKLPNNEEKQTNLTSDDKMLRSGKRTSKNEKNLENGNNLPNNDDKMQNDGTELLDEFKALLKSDEYKTEGANILINWLLEKECKIHEMNKESDKLELVLSANKVNSKNLITTNVRRRRHARNGFKLSERDMKRIIKTIIDIRFFLSMLVLLLWYYENNFSLVLIIWGLIWFVMFKKRRLNN